MPASRSFALIALLLPSLLSAKVATYPVEKVYRGQKLTGVSVFAGTKEERFQGEVMDVVPQVIGTMPLIIARLSGANLEHTGIISGMSGSPVTTKEGELVGAVAYGWTFSKEPIAGITPAEWMAKAMYARVEPEGLYRSYASLPFLVDSHFASFRAGLDVSGMRPIATPLYFSRANPRLVSILQNKLGEAGYDYLVPLQSGSGSAKERGKARVAPGQPIGVSLITGDMDWTAMGTTTFCEDQRCMGFGHPFLQIADSPMPMSSGIIHGVVPLMTSSFKLGSSVEVVGAIVDDKQEGIIGDFTREAPTVPVAFHFGQKDYAVQVAPVHPFFPILFQIAFFEFLYESLGELTDVTVDLLMKADIDGVGPVELSDTFYIPQFGFDVTVFARLFEILDNPFNPLSVSNIEVTSKVEKGRRTAELVSASLPRKKLKMGQEVPLTVSLKPYGKENEWHRFFVQLPAKLPRRQLKLVLVGGTLLGSKRLLPPVNTRQWVDFFVDWIPQNAVVVALLTGERIMGISGEPPFGLPDTLAAIFAGGHALQGQTIPDMRLYVYETPYVVSGRVEVNVAVEP